MKIVNTKKMKIILSFLGAAALITPIVAVSAVACSSENKETLNNPKIVISTEPSSQTILSIKTKTYQPFQLLQQQVIKMQN